MRELSLAMSITYAIYFVKSNLKGLRLAQDAPGQVILKRIGVIIWL